MEDLKLSGTQATASVHGSSRYRVRLTFGEEGENWSPNCSGYWMTTRTCVGVWSYGRHL